MLSGRNFWRLNMTDYQADDRQTMIFTAAAKNKSRLQELVNYAKVAGCRKLGIANCISVQNYAEKLKILLTEAGFEVFSVNCRQSGLNGDDVAPELRGPSCDPLFQAEYLNNCNTDLNIEVGLCLGHGLLFRKHSAAPVTTFLVKDFATRHKPVESLE